MLNLSQTGLYIFLVPQSPLIDNLGTQHMLSYNYFTEVLREPLEN